MVIPKHMWMIFVMSTLILLRHGQSAWNLCNLFTGWVDVPLTAKGIEEALEAGRQIADIDIEVIFTSTLMRAQQTAMIAMSQHKTTKVPVMQHQEGQQAQWSKIYNDKVHANTIPVHADWHLNERFYGELQGLDKDETRQKYGEEQVHIWRRSFDVPPPEGESLAMTAERTLPYFDEHILPQLKAGKNVLVAAHGNSLRSIAMQLEQLTPEQVLKLELPTGVPRFYHFDQGTFHLR